jgi:hypothetical protein
MNGFFRAIAQRRQDDSHKFTRLSGALNGLKTNPPPDGTTALT